MFIAQKLKKENIVEYLLYMWQIEDLIRALNLNMDLIREKVITPYQLSDETQKKALYDWYESIIEMMRSEDAQQSGHIQLNKNIIIELEDFHTKILASGQAPEYNSKFFYVLPLINQFRMKADTGKGDIELCFQFLYGIMSLKMKNAAISEQTTATQAEISKFMILLAKNYRRYKNGEIDLD